MEKTMHPQEQVLQTFTHNGIAVDLVAWSETTWCGTIGYAANNTNEPDVGAIMNGYQELATSNIGQLRREDGWDVCISVNYLSSERPNGVMFGFLASTEPINATCDVYIAPAAQYMRIRISEETAIALGHAPWMGGIPPHGWIGEQLAPQFGYTYGCDTLPVVEYYGFYNPSIGEHEYCYLYVPVQSV